MFVATVYSRKRKYNVSGNSQNQVRQRLLQMGLDGFDWTIQEIK